MSEVEWGWKAQRPASIQEVFSHEVHETVLEKEGFACSVCHPMGALIEEEKEEEKMYDFSKEVFFPGKETCHFCHFNPKGINVAPGRCGLCHFDLLEVQPANHQFDWGSKHGVYAKADGGDCGSCHLPKFCEDCHQRRDLPTQRVHDRNFRFVHGMEARVNPKSCGNCHELIGFCASCHIEGGYER
ncbi:MAG TPA: hypothetical protein VGB26_02085 [Nitrospiria bacterium]